MLTSKIWTLFQHICAVAVVNAVTILSRSIASSFHLKRSVALWKGVCGRGSALDPAGGAYDAPRPFRPHSTPSTSRCRRPQRLTSVKPIRISSWTRPCLVTSELFNFWAPSLLPPKITWHCQIPIVIGLLAWVSWSYRRCV